MFVKFQFNASWFYEGFSKIQKLQDETNEFPSMDFITQQQVEIEKLSHELKLKQAILQNMKDVFFQEGRVVVGRIPLNTLCFLLYISFLGVFEWPEEFLLWFDFLVLK